MQTLDALTSLLKSHPFLAGLTPEFYEFFHRHATIRRFASQQQIFHEGGEADHFYLILFGEVALDTLVPGCGTVTIQRLGPREALGWSWLFPPYQWHFTATTLAPTEVISFNAEALRAKAAENRDFHNELLIRVAKTLFERLQGTRMQLITLYGNSPPNAIGSG
jgi:CRP-like cAMP-binding protein